MNGSFHSQVRAWESPASTEHTWDCSYTVAPGVSGDGEGADSRATQTDSQPFFICENAFHWPLQDSIVRNSHRGSNPVRPVWQSRFHRSLSGQRSQYGLRGLGTSGGDRWVLGRRGSGVSRHYHPQLPSEWSLSPIIDMTLTLPVKVTKQPYMVLSACLRHFDEIIVPLIQHK